MKFESTYMTAAGKPRKLHSSKIRDAVARFEETGCSGVHSTHGHLLSHILNHCVRNNIAFRLAYEPNGGYYVWRRPNGADFNWQPPRGRQL